MYLVEWYQKCYFLDSIWSIFNREIASIYTWLVIPKVICPHPFLFGNVKWSCVCVWGLPLIHNFSGSIALSFLLHQLVRFNRFIYTWDQWTSVFLLFTRCTLIIKNKISYVAMENVLCHNDMVIGHWSVQPIKRRHTS